MRESCSSKHISAKLIFFSYSIQSQIFLQPQLTLWQLNQTNLESPSVVRSQLSPSIQSGFSPCAGLQVVAQFRNPVNSVTTVTPNWYQTHAIPKLGLQSSWITSACYYTRNKLLEDSSEYTETSIMKLLRKVNRIWWVTPTFLYFHLH